MKNLSVLIKPASGKCNLRCHYCFYNDLMENRQVEDYGMMSIDTANNLIKKAIEFTKDGYCLFAFQGGEPTLRGIDYFKEFIALVKKYNIYKTKVSYTIQTNGMVIDDEWSKFFYENNFLVGLSLDGYKDVNDINRVDKNNKGTYNKILKASKKFDKYKVKYNIVTVINKNNTKKIASIYKFYKKNNFQFLQFIPCLDPIKNNFDTKKYSLSIKDYEVFLNILFNYWYKDFKSNNIVNIRFFNNIISIILGYAPESCDMRGQCSIQNVIEADGSVYPCDFFVIDKYKIGNINKNSFEDISKSDIAKNFIKESEKINIKCSNCKWFNLCHGGCKRYKDSNDNYVFCDALYNFYEKNYEKLLEVSKIIKFNLHNST